MSNALDASVMAQQTETETETKPEYVTKAELANIVNQAVSGHLKRTLGKSVGEAIETAFAARESANESKQDAQGRASGAAAKDAEPWQKEIEALKRKVADSEKRAKDANLRAATDKGVTALTAALTASGKLRPEAVPVVVDLLTKAHGRLAIDDSGNAGYKLSDDETVSIEEGAKSFLASKEAALFMAPPQGGNGSRSSSRAPIAHNGQSQNRDEKTAYLNDLISGLPGIR